MFKTVIFDIFFEFKDIKGQGKRIRMRLNYIWIYLYKRTDEEEKVYCIFIFM